MNARQLFFTILVAPSLTFAQVDEWNTFPTGANSSSDSVEQGDALASTSATDPQHSPSTLANVWNAPNNRRVTPGLVGSSGLVHTAGATLGPRGILSVGMLGEYFGQQDFPVRGASNARTAGTFAVSYVPLPWLEGYLGYAAAANSNSSSSPTLIQALGDVTLGAKLTREWMPGLHAGVDVRLQSFSSVGKQDFTRYAWGFAPQLLLTYDVRTRTPRLPMLVHFNAGFQFDSTGGLVGGSRTLTAAEEFAYGVNRYNRMLAAAAIELPIAVVAPYLEYAAAVPLGVPDGELPAASSSGPSTVPANEAMRQTLGVGARVTALKDVTFTAGMDFGLASAVGLGVPATPPWNLFVGAAFNIDPLQRPPHAVEKYREPPRASLARIEGVVVDARNRQPLPGATVAMVGAGTPPAASDGSTGRFVSADLKPGKVTLRVEKAGYRLATQDVTLEAGRIASVEFALEPNAANSQLARLLVSVMGGEKKRQPVAAEMRLKGPVDQSVQLASGHAEPSRVEVPPGRYRINVVAPEYLAQTREVDVGREAEVKLAFDLEPLPRKKLVVVKPDKIAVLEQVNFGYGRAMILPGSHGLLNQVVDAMIKSDIKRIRIEGHTDNKGSKKINQKLSEDRARAVAAYLAKQGIDPSRIETAGLGDSRPLAPNLSARGRDMNRRVEFIILER